VGAAADVGMTARRCREYTHVGLRGAPGGGAAEHARPAPSKAGAGGARLAPPPSRRRAWHAALAAHAAWQAGSDDRLGCSASAGGAIGIRSYGM
jgi:hypothetical protein